MNPENPRTPREKLETRLTALLMGELPPEEAATIRALMAADPELTALHERLRKALELLGEASALPEQPAPLAPVQLSSDRREKLFAHFKTAASAPALPVKPAPIVKMPRQNWTWIIPTGIAAAVIAVLGIFVLPPSSTLVQTAANSARPPEASSNGVEVRNRAEAGNVAPFEKLFSGSSQRHQLDLGSLQSTPSPTLVVNGTTDNKLATFGGSYAGGTFGTLPQAPAAAPVLAKTGAGTIVLPPTPPALAGAGGIYLPPEPPASTSGIAAVGGIPQSPNESPSDVFNTVRVDASKQRLMNLNYFAKVDTYPEDAPDSIRRGAVTASAATNPSVVIANTGETLNIGNPEDQKKPFLGDLNGAFTFGGVNSYSGGTTVFAGTLLKGGSGAWLYAPDPTAAAPLVVGQAVTGVSIPSGNTISIAGVGGVTLSGANTFGGGTTFADSGNVTLGAYSGAGNVTSRTTSPPARNSPEVGNGASSLANSNSSADIALNVSAGPIVFRSNEAVVVGRDAGDTGQEDRLRDHLRLGQDISAANKRFTLAGNGSIDSVSSSTTGSGKTAAESPLTINGNIAVGALSPNEPDNGPARSPIRPGDEKEEVGETWEGKVRKPAIAELGQQTDLPSTKVKAPAAGVAQRVSDDADGVPNEREWSTPSAPPIRKAMPNMRADESRVAKQLDDATKVPEASDKKQAALQKRAEMAEAALENAAKDSNASAEEFMALQKQYNDARKSVNNSKMEAEADRRQLEERYKAQAMRIAPVPSAPLVPYIREFPKGIPPASPAEPMELAKLQKKEALELKSQLSKAKSRNPKSDGAVSQERANEIPRQRLATPATPQPEVLTRDNAFSTFSLNVSDVSFKLAAATLEQGRMPDPSSVRSEEFVNAFDYRDPEPAPGAPLAFASERARYPFAQNRDLLRFSVKTAAAGRQPGRPLNIVLLLDKSGSMERADRVNIVREALRVLAAQLQPQDKLSIVTFARTPRLWADGVRGDKAGDMIKRVSEITPEGGTNLEAALDLGYETALRHYTVGSISRVVLFTDGAANLGDVDPAALTQKVETHRKKGVALDCFGIGWEGYNDDLLEQLTRNGDGRYGFINTPEEAAANFAAQLAGALQIAASDVKTQVEFNPRRVIAYRQIGYAKHQLTKEQFRDNTVNAAQIGAAESGNALYVVEVDPRGEGDLATVRVRFRVPGTDDYREHEWAVPFNGNAQPLEQSTPALRLAGTAAAFSEMLATSPYAAEVTSDHLLGLLNGVPATYGADPRPKKLEWMIRQAKNLSGH